MSLYNKKYNVIILAGGLGTRMGVASDYIPKALSKFGSKRAIDYIIERYIHVAHKFIIGTGYHNDLLENYIKGEYPNLPVVFSYEKPEELINPGISTMYCLDNADSRYGTIISFCDLIMLDNLVLNDDTIYYVDLNTEGNIGDFRHSVKIKNNFVEEFIQHEIPIKPSIIHNGVLGTFVFSNTILLKTITYSKSNIIKDLTWDIVSNYNVNKQLKAEHCKNVVEFGNDIDLIQVRKSWENL